GALRLSRRDRRLSHVRRSELVARATVGARRTCDGARIGARATVGARRTCDGRSSSRVQRRADRRGAELVARATARRAARLCARASSTPLVEAYVPSRAALAT